MSVLAQTPGIWKAAPSAPPSNNVPAPLNTGALPQGKLGNLGIGTITPAERLQVSGGNILVDNQATFAAKNTSGAEEYWMWPRWSDNTMYTNFGANGWNIRNNASNPVMFMTNGGNVGIGTTNPTATLDVNGTVKFSAAGIPGAGKVLTSDANGNATWQYSATAAAPVYPICAAGETLIPGGSTQSYITAASSICKCFMKTGTNTLGQDLGYNEVNGNCGTNYVDSQWGCDGNGCGLTSCALRATYMSYGYGTREQRYTNGAATCYRDYK